MEAKMKRIFLVTLTVTMMWSAYAANAAQSPAPTPPPCCAITNIDSRSGVVTAQQLPSGQALQFMAPASLLPNLKVGQRVWLDQRTQIVSVEGALNCCRLATAGAAQGSTGSAATAQKGSKTSRGGLDSIKPGDIPPVTASPEPTTAGAIRGRPATPSPGTQDRGSK
jgi:hypothetical protein